MNETLVSQRLLSVMVPEVYKIIDEARKEGKFPSNKKVAYLLKDSLGIELSRSQISKIRRQIPDFVAGIKTGF